MIQSVIFDMDGLMFDTERMWADFWAPALAEMGETVRPGLDEACRGSAGEALFATIRGFYGPDFDAPRLVERLNAIAAREFQKPVPEKPGLTELLSWLEGHHIPLAVASSSPEHMVRTNLRNNGIEQRFSVIVTGDMVSSSKPDPAIFILAAERLGVSPKNCLVLEDSYNGVRAGRAGGFLTVMVPDLSPANDEMRALFDAVYPTLADVRDALASGALS